MKDNITLTINDKIHKLVHTNELTPCSNCSIYKFCKEVGISVPCPATGLGGEYFVELKIEK